MLNGWSVMNPPQKSLNEQIKEYMRECINDNCCCVDSAGVISPTQLAEFACDEFDGWDEDDNVPELFFELAIEVQAEYEEPAIEDDYEWIRKGC